MHPKATLEALGIRARKSLSQNFLTSPHWAERLAVRTLDGPNATEIWEVGPGLGALTSVLLARAKVPVRAFEYDRALSQYLRETYPSLDLHEGDFLEADLEKLLAAEPKVSFLSNVPYHLSSALIFRLLPYRHRFVRFVMTFQREFAERLSAKPRTPQYAGLTVMVQTFFEVDPIGVVPPGAFYPVPDVDSAAVMLVPRPEVPVAAEPFEKLVRTAFAHRRKKLAGNLKGVYPGHDFERILTELGHSAQARPEELSREDFQRLAARIASE
jgi:16S rRNA (adenine1518-N6/adenine1519-N6)-dimethyltransferase